MTANTDSASELYRILHGQYNFRDLGGLPAGNGSVTKKGLLYRSGDLSAITDRDIAVLEDLGLAMIIDFRSDKEISQRPNRPIQSVREIRCLAISPDAVVALVRECLKKNGGDKLESIWADEYRRIIRENQEAYRTFLAELAFSPHLPVVFHCAAGKDRTGLAAFFLLAALGVNFDSIVNNYLESTLYNAPIMEKAIAQVNAEGRNGEVMRPIMEVRRKYLDAALEEIQAQYGGLQEFVTTILQADVTRLRKRFLQPAV